MIRILLVDDQNLVQQGIKSLLEQDEELKVVGTVKDGKSAIRQIKLLSPDIVLLDIEMPGMNGISVTKYVNHFLPQTKVIILTSHEDKKYLIQALVAGAKAYILKSSLMADLKQAILAVDNGYSQIESRLLAKVLSPNNIKSSTTKSYTSETEDINNQAKDEESFLSTNQSVSFNLADSHNVLDKEIGDHANTVQSLTQAGTTGVELETPSEEEMCSQEESPQTSQAKNKEQEKYQRLARNNESETITTSVASSLTDSTSLKPETVTVETTIESEQKTKIQSNDSNELIESEQKTIIPHTNIDHSRESTEKKGTSQLSSHVLDEPSYQEQLHGTTYDLYHSAHENALVPVSISSLSTEQITFGSNLKKPKSKISIVSNYFQQIGSNPKVSKFTTPVIDLSRQATLICKAQISKYAQPIISKCSPTWGKYKSKLLLFSSQKNTQKWLGKIGLMLLGGMIVWLLHSL